MPDGIEGRLRQSAEEILSFNLGDLDLRQLEKRLALIDALSRVDPGILKACPDLSCGSFDCGTFTKG